MLEKWQIREVDKMLRLNKISFISFRSEKYAGNIQKMAFLVVWNVLKSYYS